MAAHGRIPLRSDERLGHPHGPAGSETPDKLEVFGEVIVPPAHPAWHGLAKSLYRSMTESGQSEYYEPSDWGMAQLACHLISEGLKSGEMTGSMLAQINGIMSRLLVTEGDRRRYSMEISRVRSKPADDPSVPNLADRRAALTKPRKA